MNTKVIMLKQTCTACPEQYDAIYDGTTIAYLRLRHGSFTVECPDVGGQLVYHTYVKGDGRFADKYERKFHLQKAKEAICNYYNNP